MGDKKILDVAHHLQCKLNGKNTGVLSLILFEYIGLNGTANRGEHVRTDMLNRF